jgi:crossover junction endodeoxyribonuclease RusA
VEYRITTPFRKPPLTMNELRRAHHYQEAKAKKEVAEVVAWHAKRQGIKDLGPSTITITWFPPMKRKRDNDALAVFCKATKDALVSVGVWPDDNSEWVVADHLVVMPEPDRENPRIEILIKEVNDYELV